MSTISKKSIRKLPLTTKIHSHFSSNRELIFKIFPLRNIVPKMVSAAKKVLNLQEPEIAFAWVDAFKGRCRAEKKVDVEANGGNPVDLQVTDQFLIRCGVESLSQMKSLVAPTEVETMPFTDKETVLRN